MTNGGAHDTRTHWLAAGDRKSTRLNSSHSQISYAVFCLKKKIINEITTIPDHLVFVVTDYHEIEANNFTAALTSLVEQPPPKPTMVIVPIDDRTLPVAR